MPCENIEDLDIPTDAECVKESLDQEVGVYWKKRCPGAIPTRDLRLRSLLGKEHEKP
jgi:hypothetical protein